MHLKTYSNFPVLWTLLFLFILGIIISGCNESAIFLPVEEEMEYETDPNNPDQMELDFFQTLWEESNLQDYSYQYNVICYCAQMEDIFVEVKMGAITDVHFVPSGDELDDRKIDNLFTIERFFEEIQQAIADEVFTLEVTYNAELGYPENIFINPLKGLVDEEVEYPIKNFNF